METVSAVIFTVILLSILPLAIIAYTIYNMCGEKIFLKITSREYRKHKVKSFFVLFFITASFMLGCLFGIDVKNEPVLFIVMYYVFCLHVFVIVHGIRSIGIVIRSKRATSFSNEL